MTELVVGRKKGLFLVEGEPGSGFEIKTRAFPGHPVDFAMRDPRSLRLFATVTSPFYGPKIFHTDGDQAGGRRLGRRDVADRGSRPYLAAGQRGAQPGYLPEEALEDENAGRCVHHVERAPRQPERMFMQFHGGVYRSDDAGESWTDVGGGGLPSEFGFPLRVDPADPDSAYVIPLLADMDRVTPDGRVRVYETRDGGSHWVAQGDGLPAEHAYLTVLCQAFSCAGAGPQLELYFGATSGDLFGSGDAGSTWSTIATRLAPVYSVVAV